MCTAMFLHTDIKSTINFKRKKTKPKPKNSHASNGTAALFGRGVQAAALRVHSQAAARGQSSPSATVQSAMLTAHGCATQSKA